MSLWISSYVAAEYRFALYLSGKIVTIVCFSLFSVYYICVFFPSFFLLRMSGWFYGATVNAGRRLYSSCHTTENTRRQGISADIAAIAVAP